MVLRTLLAFNRGLAAGIVLGAKVPIVAPARRDAMETRMASCVLAALLVRAAAKDKTKATNDANSLPDATPLPNPFVAA